MSLYVRIEDGEVKNCQGTTDDRPGWKSAVEVRPTIIPHRQVHSNHIFDLTKDPVEIIYLIENIEVDVRKVGLKSKSEFLFKQIVEIQGVLDRSQYNAEAIETARQQMNTKIAAIDACTTHDQLDALALDNQLDNPVLV